MKIDPIYALIAAVLSGLLAWGCYELSQEDLKVVSAIVSFITLAATSIAAFAVKTEEKRSLTTVKATAGAAFVLFIIENYAFSFFNYPKALYIILNLVLLCLLLIICRAVANSKM